MKWPWRRTDRRLEQAQKEQAEVKRRGRAREPLIRRAEQHLHENSFGERFRTALGGRP